MLTTSVSRLRINDWIFIRMCTKVKGQNSTWQLYEQIQRNRSVKYKNQSTCSRRTLERQERRCVTEKKLGTVLTEVNTTAVVFNFIMLPDYFSLDITVNKNNLCNVNDKCCLVSVTSVTPA